MPFFSSHQFYKASQKYTQQNIEPMEKVEALEREGDHLKGQAAVLNCMYGFMDTMVLKCATQLRIADIINSHGSPMPITQLTNTITHNHPSMHTIDRLSRVMTLLVRRGIFCYSTPSPNDPTPHYGLTSASKFLLSDNESSLSPFVIFSCLPFNFTACEHLNDCVKEGCTGAAKVIGMEDGWKFLSSNQELSTLMFKSLECLSKTVVEALKNFPEARKVFEGCGDLMVDVGGGHGVTISKIVDEFPNIVSGINFDLPHVVAEAPKYEGVSHVCGDMFSSIPRGDALLLKSVLHGFDDDNCMKILKNCRKAIPKETGKIIIIEIVLEPTGESIFDDARVAEDLKMMVFRGSKERTTVEWKRLLEEAGFPFCNIIKIPALASIIEAYPRID